MRGKNGIPIRPLSHKYSVFILVNLFQLVSRSRPGYLFFRYSHFVVDPEGSAPVKNPIFKTMNMLLRGTYYIFYIILYTDNAYTPSRWEKFSFSVRFYLLYGLLSWSFYQAMSSSFSPPHHSHLELQLIEATFSSLSLSLSTTSTVPCISLFWTCTYPTPTSRLSSAPHTWPFSLFFDFSSICFFFRLSLRPLLMTLGRFSLTWSVRSVSHIRQMPPGEGSWRVSKISSAV